MRQLERVLQPALSDLQLDWGSAAVEQVTPAQLKPLFSGERLTVYAFLADDNKVRRSGPFSPTVTTALTNRGTRTRHAMWKSPCAGRSALSRGRPVRALPWQEALTHDFLIFTCKQNAPIAEMKLPKRPRKGATLHALTAKQLIKELEVADVRPRR
jgi:hypothetical protein